MKVVVTGGAGFIGSHLVDAYLERGDEVLVLDDFSAGKSENLEAALRKGARLYPLELPESALVEVLRDFQPDLINHHAAQKSVRDSVEDPQKDARINLMGLLNVLEAARAVSCSQVIFASSGGVIYGEQEEFPAFESHPKKPVSPYGVSKYSSELYLEYYCQQWGFNVTSLRYANVYGPRQDPFGEAGVVAIFSERMKQGEVVKIFGSGKQTRDFVYVDDVVRANLLAGEKMNAYQAYNVGTAQESSVLDLYQNLAEFARYRQSPQFEAAQPGEQLRSSLSYQKIQQKLGWKPETSLAEGLKTTFQCFLSA